MFLALREKETTRAWSFRVRYGTANQRSFRFVFCQISFPPLPSPPPSPVFLSSNRQNEIWGRDHSQTPLKVLLKLLSEIFFFGGLAKTFQTYLRRRSIFNPIPPGLFWEFLGRGGGGSKAPPP